MMERILRINMKSKIIKYDPVPEKYKYLGARCLTSRIIYDEVSPECSPLDRNNKLVFAPGILSGTTAPSSSRISLGCKSPLTNGIKESSAGGTGSMKLARHGIKAVIIEEKPDSDEEIYTLIIGSDTELILNPDLKGLGCYETMSLLIEKYGAKSAVFCIGPAGELQMLSSNIGASDTEGKPTRQFGRGGVGAVMGSKGLKAVVITDPGSSRPEILKPKEFKENVKIFSKAVINNPVSGQALPKFGTAVLLNMVNKFGALPTRNFSSGQFELAENISGEKMTELQLHRGGKVGHACSPGCVVKCSNIYVDNEGMEITGGFEYESICLLGSNLGIGDLDQIAVLNRICDDVGVDTVEVGVSLGIAMEAGIFDFGDFQGSSKLINEIAKGSPLGRIVGQGAEITGKVLGVKRIPAVKGQAMAAYDPRPIKGMGATYATSPMGADHTAAASVTVYMKADENQQIDLAKDYQVKATAMENTGLCRFVSYALFSSDEAMDAYLGMINSKYNINQTVEDFYNLGIETLRIEHDYNISAGYNGAHDSIPEIFYEEELPPYNKKYSFTLEDHRRITEEWK